VRAVERDAMHAVPPGEHTRDRVADVGVVVPARLPEPRGELDVLRRHFVSGVVRHHAVVAEQVGDRVLRGSRDDVPPDSSLGQVIERREATSELNRMIEAGRLRHDEAEPVGVLGEDRNQVIGIEAREVDALLDGHLWQVAVDQRVPVAAREEEEVETRVLDDPRHPDPMLRVEVSQALTARVRPTVGAAHLRAHHLEDTEVQRLAHCASHPSKAAFGGVGRWAAAVTSAAGAMRRIRPVEKSRRDRARVGRSV
jgi:hypothetical protein